MKLYAGWYIVGIRNNTILALVAGPLGDRTRLVPLFTRAGEAAGRAFGLDDGDTFAIAWVALPSPVPGVCNDALWIKPEYQEYDA